MNNARPHPRVSRISAVIVGLVIVAVIRGHSQRQDTIAAARSQQLPDEPDVGNAILGGLGLGAAGFLAGGGAAFYVADRSCSPYDDCCPPAYGLVGAAAGASLGMALGVHLGNDRRGSYFLDALTGAAVWGLGIAVTAGSGWDESASLMATLIPVAQITATVAVERSVARARARRP